MSLVKTAIIVSISSDIGTALAEQWLAKGWTVYGTYRTRSDAVERLALAGAHLVYCHMIDRDSLDSACEALKRLCPVWDVLVVAHGTTEPIGSFETVDFDEWSRSIEINFTSQLRLTHHLLPTRRTQGEVEPTVIFFAGGGTNNATLNYSAYTVSKIALIKMCELLDAEILNVKFSILGPGWVKTKIHNETLRAGMNAGNNFDLTQLKLEQDDFSSMEAVLDCCDWLVSSPRAVVGGRNFSVVHDGWGSDQLNAALLSDPDMYKLRRAGNQLIVGRRVHFD